MPLHLVLISVSEGLLGWCSSPLPEEECYMDWPFPFNRLITGFSPFLPSKERGCGHTSTGQSPSLRQIQTRVVLFALPRNLPSTHTFRFTACKKFLRNPALLFQLTTPLQSIAFNTSTTDVLKSQESCCPY